MQRLPLSHGLVPLLLLEPVDRVFDSLAQHEVGHAHLLFEGLVAVVLEHFSVAFRKVVLEVLAGFRVVVGERLDVEISSGAHERALVVHIPADSPVSLETVILRLEPTYQIA